MEKTISAKVFISAQIEKLNEAFKAALNAGIPEATSEKSRKVLTEAVGSIKAAKLMSVIAQDDDMPQEVADHISTAVEACVTDIQEQIAALC